MSNSTQNDKQKVTRADIKVTMTFYPREGTQCGYCGISSFAHRHKAGSLPKDFERLPDASKTLQEDHEHDYVMDILMIMGVMTTATQYGKIDKILTKLRADARKEALLKDRFEERDRLKKISNDEQYIRKQMYHGIDHENWDKYKSWAKLIANMVYGFNGSDKSNPPMKGLDQATQTLVDCLSDARKEVLANVAIMLWNLHKDEWSPGDRKWNEALDCAIEKSATLREEEKHG